ncbi:class I SAM-dependent methyltransferase [Streptomyces olivaceus]|uniref:SAM-dependent methyltransferase n=1 Tax=Streptomyces olivaceus TaxID=47716 RepID=A0A5P9NY99_STROV|nr:hypothetical protein [Streptomyces olivaceus]QFU80884.1 SAM-dependent methyltransferase [Streptomyces olivaceus]
MTDSGSAIDNAVFDERLANFQKWQETPWGQLRYSVVAANLDRHLDDRPLRVLDVAGGNGREAVRLAARGHHVTVLDVAPVSLAGARDIAAEHGIPGIRRPAVRSSYSLESIGTSKFPPASQSRIPVEHRQVRIRDSEEGTPARGWAYFTYPARLTPLDTPRKVYTNPLAKSCISCEKGWIYRKNRYNDPEAGLCSGKCSSR